MAFVSPLPSHLGPTARITMRKSSRRPGFGFQTGSNVRISPGGNSIFYATVATAVPLPEKKSKSYYVAQIKFKSPEHFNQVREQDPTLKERHGRYLSNLMAQNKAIAVGPFMPFATTQNAGIWILRTSSLEEAVTCVKDSPYFHSGAISEDTLNSIYEWTPRGALIDAFVEKQ